MWSPLFSEYFHFQSISMHRPSFGPHNNPVRQAEQRIIISILQVGKHAQRIYMACPKSKSEPGTESQFFRAPSLYQSIPEKSMCKVGPCNMTRNFKLRTGKAGTHLSQWGVGMEIKPPGWVQAQAPSPRLRHILYLFLFKGQKYTLPLARLFTERLFTGKS